MSLSIEIKVVPASGKQKWAVDKQGKLKCFLKAPPIDGKANEELIILLSRALKIRKDQLRIIVGQTSRKKIIKIDADVSFDQLLIALGVEKQQLLF